MLLATQRFGQGANLTAQKLQKDLRKKSDINLIEEEPLLFQNKVVYL